MDADKNALYIRIYLCKSVVTNRLKLNEKF